MKLVPGLYEQVINKEIDNELNKIADACKAVSSIDKAEASKILAQYMTDIVQKGLDNIADNGGGVVDQIELVNRIVNEIKDSTKEADFAEMNVDLKAEQLFAVLRSNDPSIVVGKKASDTVRPETSISQSSLFTGAVHEPQMFSELKKEIRLQIYFGRKIRICS